MCSHTKINSLFRLGDNCYDEVMQDLERIIGDTRFTSIGIEAPRSHVQSSACTLARDIG